MASRLRASWLTECEEVSDDMVVGLDCEMKTDIGVCVCEACVQGKHQRARFQTADGKRSDSVLGLMHSDVCGNINTKSLSGCAS